MLLKKWQKCEIYSFFIHFYPEILKVDSNNAVHLIWCGRRDLNPHELLHWNLKPARLPIPPRPHIKLVLFFASVRLRIGNRASSAVCTNGRAILQECSAFFFAAVRLVPPRPHIKVALFAPKYDITLLSFCQ